MKQVFAIRASRSKVGVPKIFFVTAATPTAAVTQFRREHPGYHMWYTKSTTGRVHTELIRKKDFQYFKDTLPKSTENKLKRLLWD